MRRVFASARLDNVHAIRALLEEAGIATQLSNARSWNRATARDFSYARPRDNPAWPAVWVIDPNDYRRALELLRQQGIELPTSGAYHADGQVPRDATRAGLGNAAKRRLALLALVVLAGIWFIWNVARG